MSRKNLDLCQGPLLKNIILYALPLMGSGVLQLLYNAADLVVVARWSGGTALAAVGMVSPLINLVINLFIGLSVGASVVVAQYYGAGNKTHVEQAVHTAMSISLIGGVLAMAVGELMSPLALQWMGTPADVIDQADLYLRIYFLGLPASMIYNFGAAVLRAVGDTRRPLYILSFTGLINVGLNLWTVIGLHWDVAGVAVATTVSQVLSAVLVVLCLCKAQDSYQFSFRKLCIKGDKLRLIVRHGLPAGLNGMVFSFSNIIIQSSINEFGTAAISGCAASGSLEGFTYVIMDSFNLACLAFVGQNLGARNLPRIRRSCGCCVGLVTVVGFACGMLLLTFGEPLLRIYTAASGTDAGVPIADILSHGLQRMRVVAPTYFLCGIMNTIAGALRGLGQSWSPTVITASCVCGVRLMWIFTVFRFWWHSITSLFLSWTLSWTVAALILALCLWRALRRVSRDMQPAAAGEAS